MEKRAYQRDALCLWQQNGDKGGHQADHAGEEEEDAKLHGAHHGQEALAHHKRHQEVHGCPARHTPRLRVMLM